MTVAQVIAQARSGELNGLSAESYDDAKLLNYINLGVLELYKRFALKVSEALITMPDDVTTIFTLSALDPNVHLGDGDLMYVIAAYDEKGDWININAPDDPLSILTPTFNTVQVPNPVAHAVISIIYAPEPPMIQSTSDDLPLPATLLEALLHYIGYRAHGALNGNLQAENNSHYQRFELSCAKAKNLGVVTADNMMTRPVEAKGFI